jgi:hypothetical protein
LVRETCFEAFLVDFGFGTGEWFGLLVVGIDEGIYMGSQFCDRGEGGAGERLIGQIQKCNRRLTTFVDQSKSRRASSATSDD